MTRRGFRSTSETRAPKSSFARGDVNAIVVSGRGGDDTLRIDDTNGAFTDTIPTTISGDRSNDELSGGAGAETLRGGSGDDDIDGGRDNDLMVGGRGKDTFDWDPGEGSDTLDGEAGDDTMDFNGANAPENVTLTANGSRLLFSRDVANVTMDTGGVETIDFVPSAAPTT